MNLFSILRLSLHNLWNNKLRTLLTVIVITVVSFVVVLLAGVGYSFYKTLNANVSYMFSCENSYITVRYEVYDGDRYVGSGAFTPEQVEQILGILDNDDGYITSVGFIQETTYSYGTQFNMYSDFSASDGNSNLYVFPYYANSNPFIGTSDDGSYLAGGRMWSASDTGSMNCWLDKSQMSRYNVGDTVSLTRRSESYGPYENPSVIWSEKFTVAGFLDLKSSSNSGAVFIDYKQFDDEKEPVTSWESNRNKMVIRGVYAKMIPQEGFRYGVKTQKYLKNLVKRLNEEIVPTESGGKMQANCDILDEMMLASVISIVVIALIAVIALIIILLSIGSVANTIKISAEQNRKFFGVMKAIGMKNKSLRHVLIGQIIIMTVLGVAFASLAAYLMIGVAESMLGSLVNSLFWNMESPIVICGISPLIPVGIALLLVGFVLLFTRSSLHEFSKMDVISVINEVN